jgi:NAD(P)-dependent dehydrogenase (short-subunit alcohol dehydrogenase family)
MKTKTALVTGVSRTTGIGFAICKQLLSEGYYVHAVYNSENLCESEFAKFHPNQYKMYQVDFTDREQRTAFVEELKKETFNLIVNNAGAFSNSEEGKYEELNSYYDVFEVNFFTPVEISLGLFNSIVEKGVIINIASTDGLRGVFSSTSYAASKAALMNVTQSFANNFGYDKKIRVLAIAPGWVKTSDNMGEPEILEIGRQLTPLERFAEPQEIANYVSFLASDKAVFITGSTQIIDGGLTGVDYTMLRESGRTIQE